MHSDASPVKCVCTTGHPRTRAAPDVQGPARDQGGPLYLPWLNIIRWFTVDTASSSLLRVVPVTPTTPRARTKPC
eukprot:1193617-Prorocentrum_minimum.AAC.8